MTVKEMFEKKYREKMANITENEWGMATEWAKYYKKHPAEYVMRNLEITEKDFYDNGIYYHGGELETLHQLRCIASNRHRQERGHVTRYWLTHKGYNKLFKVKEC